MKGKGFPMLRGRSNGDQLVKVQLFTPTKISKNVKKKIQDLGDEIEKIKNPFSKIDI